jgi:hypothetical protein
MNNVEEDILELLQQHNLSVDSLIKKLHYYPSYLLLKKINELVQLGKIRFVDYKLTSK